METAPQAMLWVDSPTQSNSGLPHSLEHLLFGKGTKGRYASLLAEMRLGDKAAATFPDFTAFGFSSGTGLAGFFEELHAWLDALYRPDFTDLEAEREFYHFGVVTDSTTNKKTLIEKGSVYDEMQTNEGAYIYYFELLKRVLGEQNPFGFFSVGQPGEMRGVTPAEIRAFHAQHYRLGPSAGLIFALNPKENVPDFLQRVSNELDQFANSDPKPSARRDLSQPKYPIRPSADSQIKIYPFPAASQADAGEVRFSWKVVKVQSAVDLRLGLLFFRALADGEQSLLYKSLVDSKTREIDTGATTVESEPFVAESPYFPVWNVGVTGTPGNRITVERIEEIRKLILRKIRAISEYSDNSDDLVGFNRLVASYAESWQHSESVWLKSPPHFTYQSKSDWKDHLEYLEMDPSFVRSISAEPVWRAISQKLASGKNIWRDVIEKDRLLDPPYAAGSTPSPQLLEKMREGKETRIRDKIKALMRQYHTADEQEALSRFEQGELAKNKEIDAIEARVTRSHFTDHPPMTPDDDIRYTQLRIGDNVPAIATIFRNPPTLDIGISFDLRELPAKYYKYLPVLPRCFDSLGLKNGGRITPYGELLQDIQRQLLNLSVGYEDNPVSKRADLTFRASSADIKEFRGALDLLQSMMRFNYLDVDNADRLRDIVSERLFADDSYTKAGESRWIDNPVSAFRNQDNRLYLALESQFTRAHWDGRLKWLFHRPVGAADREKLEEFAKGVLSSDFSRQKLSEQLTRSDITELDRELMEYWERNLASFPESELADGFQQLTEEVLQDLGTGAAKAIEELKELQELVLNRRAIHIDLTVSESALDAIRPDLAKFIQSIPIHQLSAGVRSNDPDASAFPVMAKAEKRNHTSHEKANFPWYVGFVDKDGSSSNLVIYADLPGYSDLDRSSLIRMLASNIFSGSGPHSFYVKARETGLVYGNFFDSLPAQKILWFYADRSPDLPALIELVNAQAATVREINDPSVIDYALSQTFSFSRAMWSTSDRGSALASDIRDGIGPDKVRRFSEAILKLRNEPDLLAQLKHAGLDSICGILLQDKCKEKQKADHSIFFFVGPEKVSADVEKRLPIPNLLRVYPSDYWIQ
jgi:Zn-dependent M16 (insulinase) family peptidase